MYPNFYKIASLCEKTQKIKIPSSEALNFQKDVRHLLSVLKKYYQNDFSNLVYEQKSVLAKLEKIVVVAPELLEDDDVFENFVTDLFESGYLPHPEIYYKAGFIKQEDMQKYFLLYIDQMRMQQFIAKHWDDYKQYKKIIHTALASVENKHLKLVQLSDMHYQKKLFYFVFAVVAIVLLASFGEAGMLLIFLFGYLLCFFFYEVYVFLRASHYLHKDLIWH